MEAKQLRIGNYAQQFLGIGDDGAEYKEIIIEAKDIYRISGLENHDIEPIKLTEEWLFKLGFLKSTEYVVGVGICSFYKHPDYKYRLSEKFRLLLLDFDVKYIHDLQNILYSLTKQELIISN